MAVTYDSILKDCLADAGAKAIIDELLPGLSTHPALMMIENMPLSQVVKIPQINLPDERVAVLKERFAAL